MGPRQHGIGAFDAVVLAGGRGTRLGGIDKAALVFAGRTLLEHALDSVASAVRVCVVGTPKDLVEDGRQDSRMIVTREHPIHGGPAAALCAGLGALARSRGTASPYVAVLAADLPAPGDALATLLTELPLVPSSDGCIAVDPEGRDQPLLAVYRTSRLRFALARAEPLPGTALYRALAPLSLNRVRLSAEQCADIDDAADAQRFGIALPGAVFGSRLVWSRKRAPRSQ